MMRALLTGSALLLCMATASAQQTFEPQDFAVLGSMDKVTGHFAELELPVGVTGTFGSLEVVARSCQKTPPHEEPESTSFLEIMDYRNGEREAVFTGWMFASSPGISALEHAVYDIWVIRCTNSPGSARR